MSIPIREVDRQKIHSPNRERKGKGPAFATTPAPAARMRGGRDANNVGEGKEKGRRKKRYPHDFFRSYTSPEKNKGGWGAERGEEEGRREEEGRPPPPPPGGGESGDNPPPAPPPPPLPLVAEGKSQTQLARSGAVEADRAEEERRRRGGELSQPLISFCRISATKGNETSKEKTRFQRHRLAEEGRREEEKKGGGQDRDCLLPNCMSVRCHKGTQTKEDSRCL